MKYLTLFSALFLLFFRCNIPEEKSNISEEKPEFQYYTVSKVSDGDTFWFINEDNQKVKARLIGVDAPESHASEHKKVQFFGKEAQEYLTKMLLNKNIRIETDVAPRDKYGRLLVYAWLEDGTFVNADLIEQGYARLLTIPPNIRFAESFIKLQEDARENHRGMWNK